MMGDVVHAARPVLQVFAKAPVMGEVKTRLARTLGASAALEVHVALVAQTLEVARACHETGVVSAVELWCHPDMEHPAWRPWAQSCGATLHAQKGADLGARMEAALRHALAQRRPALLIGSDCPGFDVTHVGAAARALDTHDAVFTPAEDGGYVLVGMRRPLPCFDRIGWGTPEVMAATRARLRALQATWHELPTLWDVDVLDDYERWRTLIASAAPETPTLGAGPPTPRWRAPLLR